MKRLIVTLFYGAGLLVIIYGVKELIILYKSAYKVVRTKINKISFTTIDIILFLQITNNSDISAQIKNEFFEVFINDKKVSEIKSADLIHINSNGNTVLPIPIKINSDQLIKVAANNISNILNDKSKIKLEIKGYLSLQVGAIDLKNYAIDINYTLQDLIDMSKDKQE